MTPGLSPLAHPPARALVQPSWLCLPLPGTHRGRLANWDPGAVAFPPALGGGPLPHL